MSYWWTADTHLGHENILRYCDRPFKSLAEYERTYIRNHNERVKPEDTVFCVGDFCFKNSAGGKKGEGSVHKPEYYLSRLNGNIIIIAGNHDRNNGVKSIIQKLVVRYGGLNICAVHDPRNVDFNYGLHFIGHVHNMWKYARIVDPESGRTTDCINVGVDVNRFMPVSFEELYSGYKRHLKSAQIKTIINNRETVRSKKENRDNGGDISR